MKQTTAKTMFTYLVDSPPTHTHKCFIFNILGVMNFKV